MEVEASDFLLVIALISEDLPTFDLPVKHISMTRLYKRGFKELYFLPWQGDCASEAYFKFSDDLKVSDVEKEDFIDGRQYCWQFPNNDSDVWMAYSQKRTFCNSAYFFLSSSSLASSSFFVTVNSAPA